MNAADSRSIYSFHLNEDTAAPQGGPTQTILGHIFSIREKEVQNNNLLFIDCKEFRHLHGEFALMQQEGPTIRLVRDKIGILPLYYFIESSFVYVSISIGALIKKIGPLQVNKEYLQRIKNSDHSDMTSTLDKRIRRVPPGHYVEINKNGVHSTSYWQITSAPQTEQNNFNPSAEKLGFELLRGIRQRQQAQTHFSLFLSGGFDSSALYAGLHSPPNSLPTAISKSQSPWHSLSYVFEGDIETEHSSLKLLEETFHSKIIKIPFQSIPPAEYSHSSWPTEIFFSPGLAMLRPLFRKAKVLNSNFVWTGHGSDEIYSAPETSWTHLSLTDITQLDLYKKSFFSRVKTLLLALVYRVLYQFYRLGLPQYKPLSPHARALHLYLKSGGYVFSLEAAQEMALQYGLRMSYPFMDDRALSVYFHAKSNEVMDQNALGKRILRDAFNKILPNFIRLRLSTQSYTPIFNDILKPLHPVGTITADPQRYDQALGEYFERQITTPTSSSASNTTKVEV